jgi:HAD superfamily hydrolase (TIGR01509 family)
LQERSFELVILDCDGVLIDSEPLACAVDAEVYTAAGYPITAEEVMHRFVGFSGKDVDAMIERDLGHPLPDGYDAGYTQKLHALFRRELKAIDGIAELLDALAQRSIAVCVASSSSPERLRFTLELTNLWERVAPHVFSSALVARGKPAPDLFLYAAHKMGVDPARCLVVEDSAAGVEAARAACMHVIGFCGGGHCRSDHADRLTRAGAHAVLADMKLLREMLGCGDRDLNASHAEELGDGNIARR